MIRPQYAWLFIPLLALTIGSLGAIALLRIADKDFFGFSYALLAFLVLGLGAGLAVGMVIGKWWL